MHGLRLSIASPASARLAAVAGLLVVAAAVGLVVGRPAPITPADQEQPRLNQAAPIPRGGATIAQAFVAAHNGLSGVEVLAVVYPDAIPEAILRLRLLDADGGLLATSSFSQIAHNAPLRLSFEPQPHSAGKMYWLVLEGSADNDATAWAYSLDGYARGLLVVNGTPASGDLRFSTTYTYLAADMLGDAVVAFSRLARLALPLWLVLFAPGLLLVGWGRELERNLASFWARWGLALGLSLSLLPLAWLWVTAFGLRWSPLWLRLIYAAAGLVVIGRGLFRAFRDVGSQGLRVSRRGLSLHNVILAALLFLGLAARLLAVRDLAFPEWVDSPHHLSIVRLLATTGRIPDSYRPLLPIDRFTYHFGFHAVAATIQWFTSFTLPETLLLLGQVLNALMPLAAHTFVVGLTARPRAGVVAAFFVGLVSLFPGYYVSWGRYTQLAGLLILAPALAVAWRMVAPVPAEAVPGDDRTSHLKRVVAVGLLAAGLLLTHYRVVLFFAVFTWVALAAGARGGWKRMVLAGLLGALLALPWLLRLAAQAVLPVLRAPESLASPSGYNAFPTAYFRTGLELGWICCALLATAWGLLRRERVMWVVAGWTVVTFALLNIGPGTWLVNNNAWAITLFLPGALALGWGADRWLTLGCAALWNGTPWVRRALGGLMLAMAAGGIAYAGVQGLRAQITVANPATVLATADDEAALRWIEQNTPQSAVFLINGWEWLSDGTWAGSDGGTWIWPLTGRRTTLPPVDYAFEERWKEEVNGFNARAAKIQEAGAPEALALLRAAGVTHVFIGAKGGTLKPEMFVEDPHYRLLYTNGAAWVFAVEDK